MQVIAYYDNDKKCLSKSNELPLYDMKIFPSGRRDQLQ